MYVSDLKRALQTAEEINKTLKITPQITNIIREVNASLGNGKSCEWYNINKNPKSNVYDPDYKPFEDAESDRDLWYRLYTFYQEIISNNVERLLIVSHGTALSFLHSMIMGYSFEDIANIRFIGCGGAVSKFIIESSGKVTVNYINQKRRFSPKAQPPLLSAVQRCVHMLCIIFILHVKRCLFVNPFGIFLMLF